MCRYILYFSTIMSAQINVRNASFDDLPAILEIYNHAILHTTSVYHYSAHTMEMREHWWEEKMDNGFPVLVAETDNQIAGFGTYGKFRIWPAYKYTVEHSLYVHPQQNGKGIGSEILKNLIDHARKSEYHTLIAGIDSSNEVSIKLHRKFGFKETGTLREVGYKFDSWLDLVFMQLILETPQKPTHL